MATINTISDLLQALDEHPQWLEAVRERLLTKGIREAPRRLDDVDQHLNSLIVKIDASIANTNELLKGQEERLQSLEELLKGHSKQFKALNRYIENATQRFERQERDSSFLKGELFERRVNWMSRSLAREMGLVGARTVAAEELYKMMDSRDTSDIAPGRLKSFETADLVLEGVDQRDGPCYIAAEVSYTVDERDTVRAISTAQLLTRFTGLPARAAVVGVRRDDGIHGQVEAGEVFYWAIDEDNALPR